MPRLCESLFDASQFGAAWGVTLSFFEVYNEQVVDLSLTLTLTLTLPLTLTLGQP